MRMIDVALPKFDDDDQPVRLGPTRELSSFTQSKRNAADDDKEYHLEAPEEEPEDDTETDDASKEVFFDTEDIADGVRFETACEDVAWSLTRSAILSQKSNLHQKTFEFTFQVDRVQASIYRSALDPTQPDRLLANTVLEGFQLEFGLRPFDMSVDIFLRSLYVEDKMVDDQTEFRHLVTSKKLDRDDGTQVQDLVRIRYQGVQKTSPEFMTVHDGIDKVVFGRPGEDSKGWS